MTGLVVADANIVLGYFLCSVLGQETRLTADPSGLIESLDQKLQLCVDDCGNLEAECVALVGVEWLEPWLARLLVEGKVRVVSPQRVRSLEKKLSTLGFPGGRDFWYIRTALAAVAVCGSSVLLTEDMDFFEPREKRAPNARRLRFLTEGKGRVCRQLRREKVLVQCVAVACEFFR